MHGMGQTLNAKCLMGLHALFVTLFKKVYLFYLSMVFLVFILEPPFLQSLSNFSPIH